MELRHLQLILPRAPAAALQPLNAAMARFDLLSPAPAANFLSQLGHESADLTALAENLNYSSDALVRIWPKRFSPAEAAQYARNPERIANRAYANRMGNGDEASGDGWRFRGAGGFQLTGHDNQLACATYFGLSLAEVGDWLRTFDGACLSAGWFWEKNGLSKWAGDFDGLCDAVNIGRKTVAVGDAIGYKHRLEIRDRALKVLS